MAKSMLQVKDLLVAYGDIKAVKGISFDVQEGEIFTLIGANGAGKTTTLRALSGMIPYLGEVSFKDEPLNGLPPHEIVERGMAHVPEGRGIFGNLTVFENLKLGAWTRKDRKGVEEDFAYVFKMLPRLGERKHQAAGTLSGGEQQMLAVARALMSRASMLILDEPSMGLAPKLVAEIYKMIREINSRGVTILLVEQNANIALKLANRAAVLETGTISITGAAGELLSDPRIREAYLGA